MSSAPPTPIGYSWRALIDAHIAGFGSLASVADELVRRLRLAGTEPPDRATVERGLRRLGGRGNENGGQYGSWALRHLGVPMDAVDTLAWLAQYHSRFADLPTSVRREHLLLWDRPPISESRLVTWIHVGIASVHHRRREREECVTRLDAALAHGDAAGPMARMEASLLAARIAVDRRDRTGGTRYLDQAEALLEDLPEHLPYRTRIAGQRAFLLTNDRNASPAQLSAGRELFVQLPVDSGIPFVDYRRTAGLAYCTFRLGDIEMARRLAREACDHAGDGGFVRFRIMALNLLASMQSGDEAQTTRSRAARLARQIEDFHLLSVAKSKMSEIVS